MFLEIANHDVLQFTTQQIHCRNKQVVRERPRRRMVLHTAVDAGCLKEADQNRKRSVALNFLEIHNLLVVDLTNDNTRQFHLNGHVRCSNDPTTLGIFNESSLTRRPSNSASNAMLLAKRDSISTS